MPEIFTIGHSNRPSEEFIGLLTHAAITLVVDVRTIPKSRHNPQFNKDALEHTLRDAGIGYRRIAELGGLRSRRHGDGPSRNNFWDNENFRNYADYTATTSFQAGLAVLRALAREKTSAVMCAEALWWRCHRRIIADYLLAAGDSVTHIMANGKTEAAHLTEAAAIGADGVITYPAAQGSLL